MATQQRKTHTAPSSLRQVYLTGYNIIFALLWASIFIKAVAHLRAGSSKADIFSATESAARWVQTASLVEVLHAAFGALLSPPVPYVLLSTRCRTNTTKGIIKSPVSTTALQVVTRVIQVWMVWFCFPGSTASSSAYVALVLAWSVADGIRYLYLALNMHGKAPALLVWLRCVSPSHSVVMCM